MAETNFAALTPQQKLNWARETWSAARDQMFISRFMGKGSNNVIQRITELTKTEKGEACIFQLVADLVGDGVTGDDEREGNEEAMDSHSQIITIDQLSHGVRSKGKMAEQRTVINFREEGRDKLSYWLANRCDQAAFLTLSGISYAFNNDGSQRLNSNLPNLEFAADVSAPTAKRSLMFDGTSLQFSNTGSITTAYVPKYTMIVDLIAYAKEHRVKPLMAGGKPYYVLFLAPGSLAALKKDPDYQRAVVQVAAKAGMDSPWFTGATVTVDGAVLHEHNLVYTTKGAAAGAKWGAGGNVNGTRSLLCGAQALAMADLGPGNWVEKLFDYDNKVGLNIDKILGMLKPKFPSIYDKSTEDFGVVAVDHYIQ
ncbi:N4-gp56 family major capsid protein [Paracidovorax anthurii]|uniref:N4-gp56 family major capsid protein n=1 Tax=Paracidovorax anthurii TaxID=78229 RepID=A0A328ZFR9_9BURK|nr:N4-gp56 family major capsid protein [Paracidovorax anthurii]RAR85028.1 N4-gp56 family major capsid protein [Paracidovorax anthurii]